MRKTANLLIREASNKRTSRQQLSNKRQQLPTKKSLTSVADSTQKKWQTKQENIELQKQITQAQNLTEQEIAKIHKDAQKQATKKIKVTQTKIENDMVTFLEIQCNKLGSDLQKKQLENSKLKIEINELRKNIDFLNRKLQNVYKDHQSLAKNNDYGQMQKEQMKDEILKLKSSLSRKENQTEFYKKKLQAEIDKLKSENQDFTNKITFLESELAQLKEEKEQLEEVLQQKSSENQYLRENFEQRKREWDRVRQSLELNSKQNIEKKADKIAKSQGQIQTLQDKLKQEQTLRKKAQEKGKELEKQLARKSELSINLEEQLTQMKKRVNDLSILKSSNNTILSQKIQKVEEENAKLKKQLDSVKKFGVSELKEDNAKPFLFGPTDDD